MAERGEIKKRMAFNRLDFSYLEIYYKNILSDIMLPIQDRGDIV